MNWGRVYFGIVAVAVGALFLLENVGVIGGDHSAGQIIGDWWPTAIILAGLTTYAANPNQWAAPVILTAVGVALLLSSLGAADISSFLWPAALVVVGLVVMFGRRSRRGGSEAGDSVSSFNMFSGSELASHSRAFTGGNVSAVFGGAELDLRDSTPAPGAELDVFAAFGGVEIRVPEGWAVTVRGLPLFGGWENVTTRDTLGPAAPVLAVNATVLFGGLEVKH